MFNKNKQTKISKCKFKFGNIYHCCVQRTASQWIKTILSDPMIYESCHLKLYDPNESFIGTPNDRPEIKLSVPENTIVSPLYICHEDFIKIPKPKKYRAFFVMRDPRDLLISYFYSLKYSHSLSPYIINQRKIMHEMNTDQGITYLIERIDDVHKLLYFAILPWYREARKDKNILICRYEELTGSRQVKVFKILLRHIGIKLKQKQIKELLEKYSFAKITGGRKQGIEDQASHFRKGISGDWQNYLSPQHKSDIKKVMGQLLIDLDYETSFDW